MYASTCWSTRNSSFHRIDMADEDSQAPFREPPWGYGFGIQYPEPGQHSNSPWYVPLCEGRNFEQTQQSLCYHLATRTNDESGNEDDRDYNEEDSGNCQNPGRPSLSTVTCVPPTAPVFTGRSLTLQPLRPLVPLVHRSQPQYTGSMQDSSHLGKLVP